MSDAGVLTPYSTVAPLFTDEAIDVPEMDRERIAAYAAYEKIYWSVPRAFKLTMRGTNDQPIYVPNARTVVNETAHYLLKGMKIVPEGGDLESPLGVAMKAFFKRERFYAMFHTAKWSGVTRGDWVLHFTADPEKPEGRRLSVNAVDPAQYYPIYDDDDIDKIIGVDLVEMFVDPRDQKTYVKQLRYTYTDTEGRPGAIRQVIREERVLELDGWWKGKAAKVKQRLLKPELLPPDITTIPVYHFKNIDWQGDPFGRSEIAGFEMLMSSINQTVSDEELALALDGLGCYATDAPQPTNSEGEEEDWMVGPGTVLQIPTGNTFSRVKGVGSVTPMLEHVKMLTDSLYEGSATFRTAQVDVQLAESGVALAMRFLPTLAKLEQRDWSGTATLEQMFFDWKFWHKAYEGEDFSEKEVEVILGDKLPINRVERLNELNNMYDRQVIDTEYYRQEMEKLGYKFPKDMADRVRKEQEELAKARMFESPVNGEDPTKTGNGANNGRRPNESSGTEAKQPSQQQAKST